MLAQGFAVLEYNSGGFTHKMKINLGAFNESAFPWPFVTTFGGPADVDTLVGVIAGLISPFIDSSGGTTSYEVWHNVALPGHPTFIGAAPHTVAGSGGSVDVAVHREFSFKGSASRHVGRVYIQGATGTPPVKKHGMSALPGSGPEHDLVTTYLADLNWVSKDGSKAIAFLNETIEWTAHWLRKTARR